MLKVLKNNTPWGIERKSGFKMEICSEYKKII